MRNYLYSHYSISDELWRKICDKSFFVQFFKGDFLQSEDRECNFVNFIAQGFCSVFYESDGKEYIRDFVGAEEFCTLYSSFIGKGKARYSVKAERDTKVIRISRDGFDCLKTDPEFFSIFHHIQEEYYFRQEEYNFQMESKSAEERIKHYLEKKQIQELMKHVPQYKIASHLKMDAVTFSKKLGKLNKKT